MTIMNTWQKQVEKYIPPALPGYDFVSRIQVFIPMQEFGLTVLERQIHPLTFIHSCVLNSVLCGNAQISKLAEIFGVSEGVVLQIVAQLDTEKLISVSAGSIVLTPQGRQAIDTLTKVRITKKQINRLYMNQITGELFDQCPAGVYDELTRDSVYLHEVHPMDINFLREKFDDLSQLYKDNQVAAAIFGMSSSQGTELYRILDVAYHTLLYRPETCFVYLNQADKSLAFRFYSGIRIYEDTLQMQFTQQPPLLGAQRLLARPKMKVVPPELCIETSFPETLITAYSLQGDKQVRQQAVEAAYYDDRHLLDGEISDILTYCHEWKVDSIMLAMPRLDEFLTDTALNSIVSSGTIKRLFLHYDKDDWSAKFVLDRLNKLVKGRDNLELKTNMEENLSTVQILIGMRCAILASHLPLDTIYKRQIYRICGKITFNSERVKTYWHDWNGTL